MIGVDNGLQRRICERKPNVVYVSCAAHNLNFKYRTYLKNKDAVYIQPVQIFF